MRARHLMPLAALASFCACVDPPPNLRYLELGPGCEGTEPGKACVAMRFSVRPSVWRNLPQPLVSRLSWALYHNGEVSLTGPGEHLPVYAGNAPSVDFTDPAAVFPIHLPNAEPGDYQVLAYLDLDANGDANSGDPVTFPGDGFRVPAEAVTEVEVEFNYVR